MWEAFKRDFKERFWNFNVIRGVYLIWFGIVLHLDAVHEVEQVIPDIGTFVGVWSVIEGLRQTFANTVKMKVEFNAMVEQRKLALKATKVEEPPVPELKML